MKKFQEILVLNQVGSLEIVMNRVVSKPGWKFPEARIKTIKPSVGEVCIFSRTTHDIMASLIVHWHFFLCRGLSHIALPGNNSSLVTGKVKRACRECSYNPSLPIPPPPLLQSLSIGEMYWTAEQAVYVWTLTTCVGHNVLCTWARYFSLLCSLYTGV